MKRPFERAAQLASLKALDFEVLVVGGGFTTGDDTTGQVIKNIATESTITAQTLGYALVANAAADQTTLVFIIIDA